MSSDGRFIAFYTTSALVAEDTNGAGDIYLWDGDSRTVERVSHDPSGNQYPGGVSSATGGAVRMSPDARFLAYTVSENGGNNVWLLDRQSDRVELISKDDAGQPLVDPLGASVAGRIRLSDDGRYVSYVAYSEPLSIYEIYRYDTRTGLRDTISENFTDLLRQSPSGEYELAGDGQSAAFVVRSNMWSSPTVRESLVHKDLNTRALTTVWDLPTSYRNNGRSGYVPSIYAVALSGDARTVAYAVDGGLYTSGSTVNQRLGQELFYQKLASPASRTAVHSLDREWPTSTYRDDAPIEADLNADGSRLVYKHQARGAVYKSESRVFMPLMSVNRHTKITIAGDGLTLAGEGADSSTRGVWTTRDIPTAPSATTGAMVLGAKSVIRPGDPLTTTAGTWVGDEPMTVTYQWQSQTPEGWTDIPAATAARYTVRAEDEGRLLRSVVTATNEIGQAQSITAATSAVGAELRYEVRSDLPSDGLTNQPSVPFTLSSNVAGAQFECRVGAAAWASCTSPYTPSLREGSQTIAVRAFMGAPEWRYATEVTRTVTLDTTAPTLVSSDGPTGEVDTSTPRFEFQFSGADRTECRIDGQTWRTCTSPLTTDQLPNGEHTVEVRASDAAGNVSAIREWRFTVAVPAAPGNGATQRINGTVGGELIVQVARDPGTMSLTHQHVARSEAEVDVISTYPNWTLSLRDIAGQTPGRMVSPQTSAPLSLPLAFDVGEGPAYLTGSNQPVLQGELVERGIGIEFSQQLDEHEDVYAGDVYSLSALLSVVTP